MSNERDALLAQLDDYLRGCPDPNKVWPKWMVKKTSRLLWACREALAAPAAGASQAIDANSDSEYLRELAALLQARGLGDAALPLPGIAAHYEELRAGAAACAGCKKAPTGLCASCAERLWPEDDAAGQGEAVAWEARDPDTGDRWVTRNPRERDGWYGIGRVILPLAYTTTPPAASAVARAAIIETRCGCHPETCCCGDYTLTIDGDQITTGGYKRMRQIADAINACAPAVAVDEAMLCEALGVPTGHAIRIVEVRSEGPKRYGDWLAHVPTAARKINAALTAALGSAGGVEGGWIVGITGWTKADGKTLWMEHDGEPVFRSGKRGDLGANRAIYMEATLAQPRAERQEGQP